VCNNFGIWRYLCKNLLISLYLIKPTPWRVEVHSHALLTLVQDGDETASYYGYVTPGERAWCPLNMRLGGPQSQAELCGEEKNLLHLPGIDPLFLSCQVQSIFTIPTKLSQLRHKINCDKDSQRCWCSLQVSMSRITHLKFSF
jgi:hypothetical protein